MTCFLFGLGNYYLLGHNIVNMKFYLVACGSFFSELIKRADGRIKIAVQNCSWNNFIVSPKEWEVVLGELPSLMIKYDASHAYNRNEGYLGQLNDWCDRVAHIHIKGTTHAGKKAVADPPAGMDDIMWRPLFSILYSNGYDASIE